LKPNAPKYPTTRPDALKLARAAEDALTGIIWTDDAVTVDLTIKKRYGELPGVNITVRVCP
jgi:Holliday junction resolvase RusA-like endonuclease